MATYTEMVDKVVDWTNRNSEVIEPAQAKDFINYAVDDAYRTLRIAPLEQIYTYPAQTGITQSTPKNELGVPSDLIEPIQLRTLYNRFNTTTGQWEVNPGRTDYAEVYYGKNDVRSFYDPYIPQYETHNYTRQRNNFIVHPNFNNGDIFQLFYYRRLPEFDARYAVTTANNTAGLLLFGTDQAALEAAVLADDNSTKTITNDPNLQSTFVGPTAAVALGLPTGYYVGKLSPNWLRDQNEKAVLYGALREAAIYLSEDQAAVKFNELFQQEIAELNAEDNRRMLRGGSAQVRFDGQGLI